jgi:hypothetical protein
MGIQVSRVDWRAANAFFRNNASQKLSGRAVTG